MSQKFAASIPLSQIFKKDRVFFASNFTKRPSKIQQLFMENLREQRTNFNELRLHYFCTILYIITAKLNSTFGLIGKATADKRLQKCLVETQDVALA